jgi:hypothetical protein
LQEKFQIWKKITRHQAVDMVEWEKSELENIFSLLIFGSFIGIPSTPAQITLELLPDMEDELIAMINKIDMASGPLSVLFSNLDIG